MTKGVLILVQKQNRWVVPCKTSPLHHWKLFHCRVVSGKFGRGGVFGNLRFKRGATA